MITLIIILKTSKGRTFDATKTRFLASRTQSFYTHVSKWDETRWRQPLVIEKLNMGSISAEASTTGWNHHLCYGVQSKIPTVEHSALTKSHDRPINSAEFWPLKRHTQHKQGKWPGEGGLRNWARRTRTRAPSDSW